MSFSNELYSSVAKISTMQIGDLINDSQLTTCHLRFLKLH